MNKLPADMKNYRASDHSEYLIFAISIVCVIALFALLGWMGEEDHQARVDQIRIASKHQCT